MIKLANSNLLSIPEQNEVDRMNNALKNILNKIDNKLVTYNYDHFIKTYLFSENKKVRDSVVNLFMNSGIDLSNALHILISVLCNKNNVYLKDIPLEKVIEMIKEIFKLKECNYKDKKWIITTKHGDVVEFMNLNDKVKDDKKLKEFLVSNGAIGTNSHRICETFLNKYKTSKIETISYDVYDAFANTFSYIISDKKVYDFINNVFYPKVEYINVIMCPIHINQMGYKEYYVESVKAMMSHKKVPINIVYDTAIRRIKSRNIKAFPIHINEN